MKELVDYLKQRYKFSERRACRALEFARSTYRYKSIRKDDSVLRRRILYHAHKNIRFGYRRIYVLIRRDGFRVNIKRVRRIYSRERLSYRIPRKKRRRYRGKFFKSSALYHNDQWSIDFMHDQTSKKKKLRFLTIVDNFTRESPGVLVDRNLKSKDVIRFLEIITELRGTPRKIICDNGPEFISGNFKNWAEDKNIQLSFIRPGTPSDNAYIESFNSRFREEFLNLNIFECVEDAQSKAEDWIIHYNNVRPHGSLSNKTPNEFKQMVRSVSCKDDFG